MRAYRAVAALLAVLLASPAQPASALALVRGTLSLATGSPVADAEVRLVDLSSGRVHQARTDRTGVFLAPVAPGVYSLEARGYAVAQGPRVVTVAAGQETAAALVVASLPAAPSTLDVQHSPAGCLLVEDHAEIDAVIRPAASVRNARVYFKSARDQDYHYVEMAPEIGRFVACLPRPHAEVGPIDYYVEVEGADASRVRSETVSALLVGKADECPADRRTAMVCPCRVPVAVFGADGQTALLTAFGGLAGQVGAFVTGSVTGTAAIVAIGSSLGGISIILGDPAPASPSR